MITGLRRRLGRLIMRRLVLIEIGGVLMVGRVQVRVSIAEAAGRLGELVRRVEGGEEVVLTRDGQAAVRLVAAVAGFDGRARMTLLEDARASGGAKATAGACAARSQDFLYGDGGLAG